MPIIMGRKTFDSMKKDLPGRINFVLTKKKDWQAENATVVHDLDDAIHQARQCGTNEIFIIGGGEIFRESMNIVNRIYLTRVHTQIDGDTYYPEIKKDEWKLMESKEHPADEKNNFSFTFEVWERIVSNFAQ